MQTETSPRALRGFDVIHASPRLMVNPGEAAPSLQLATRIRGALAGAGVPPANYVGENGLDEREDLAGLNLATVPAALVELGNMRSAEEAANFEVLRLPGAAGGGPGGRPGSLPGGIVTRPLGILRWAAIVALLGLAAGASAAAISAAAPIPALHTTPGKKPGTAAAGCHGHTWRSRRTD